MSTIPELITLKLPLSDIETLCSSESSFSFLCENLNFWDEYYRQYELESPLNILNLIKRDFRSQLRKKAEKLLEINVKEIGFEYKVSFISEIKISNVEEILKIPPKIFPKDEAFDSELFKIYLEELKEDPQNEDHSFSINIFYEDEESSNLLYNMEWNVDGDQFSGWFITKDDVINIVTGLFEFGIKMEIS